MDIETLRKATTLNQSIEQLTLIIDRLEKGKLDAGVAELLNKFKDVILDDLVKHKDKLVKEFEGI